MPTQKRHVTRRALLFGASAGASAFLRQNPCYQYDFARERQELWNAPMNGFFRGWERRLAIGFEFTLKSIYASVLGQPAAAAPAQLVIRSVVDGVDTARLRKLQNVTIVGPAGGGVVIETPRYEIFTRTLVEIARRNGTILEIAGNDDIMLTVTVSSGGDWRLPQGRVISRPGREGFTGDRLLIDLKVADLATVLEADPLGKPGIEHVFDY